MDNENQTALELLNQTAVVDTNASDDIATTATSSFIPSLAVAYGTSKSVAELGICSPGDFCFANKTNLGKEIEVAVLKYRLRASIWDDGKSEYSGPSVFHMPGTPVGTDQKYQQYISQKLKAGEDLQQGTELLLWVVEAQAYAIFFFKKTSAITAAEMWKLGTGRFMKLKTTPQKGKKGYFFPISVTPCNRKVAGVNINIVGITLEDVAIPLSGLSSSMNLFLNPPSYEQGENVERNER